MEFPVETVSRFDAKDLVILYSWKGPRSSYDDSSYVIVLDDEEVFFTEHMVRKGK